jgi:hypothetical protein
MPHNVLRAQMAAGTDVHAGKSAFAGVTVSSAFPDLIVGHVADAFLRLAGGAADP